MHRRNSANSRPGRPSLRLALGALIALALTIPATAAAHPGVYTVTPKKAPGGCTFESSPIGACLEDNAVQYAIANDGWAAVFTESNGVTGVSGEGTAGMLNYKMMPSGFRSGTTGMTAEQKRIFALAQTGVQPHATCSGVAALSSGETILAWQQRSDNDPFYNYIPWQKTSAGLGDEPSKWIPVVEERAGVDLSALNSEAEFIAACGGLGGTFHKADAVSNVTSAQVAAAVAQAMAPLEAEVGSLLTGRSSLQAEIDAWKAKGGALEGDKATLAAELTSLRQQLAAAERADAAKAKTIKRLRGRLRKAGRHA